MSGEVQTDTTQTQQTQQAGNDWIAALSPELRQVVEVKGYKTPGDVVTAYANAEKAIGADKIVVPKDGEWDASAKAKLGIPADPKGYQINRPAPETMPQGLAYDDKFEEAALAAGHKVGLTPRQVQGLLDFYTSYQSEGFKALQVEQTNALNEAQALLKKEYGTAYDVNVQRAKIAAKHFGGDGLLNFLNTSGLGNHPELIRAFAKIGSQMTEDQLKVGQGSGFGVTPEQARKEANKLMLSEAYVKKDHPEHTEVVEKVQALFKQAYPDD